MIRSVLLLGALLASTPSALAATCSEQTAEFRWQGGQVRFAVEVADDDLERQKGLMFRESLPASTGMLFIYESDAEE